MRVFLKPTGLHSRAMIRVVKALTEYAPKKISVVETPEQADVRVLHVIGPDDYSKIPGDVAVIQYCGSTTPELYGDLWKRARMVWSYYDLRKHMADTPFMHAPLGVDRGFAEQIDEEAGREFDILTSGYVTGDVAEAIQEVCDAVINVDGRQIHIGPENVQGLERKPKRWQSRLNVSERDLRLFYRNSKRVSGLRRVEGFEMPVLEGALLGARPVVFDRHDMRQWYDGLAEFVPEVPAEELVGLLTDLLRTPAKVVSLADRQAILDRFDWAQIAGAFWENLKVATRVSISGASVGPSDAAKRRVLIIGDAVASTGFAKGTHAMCDGLHGSGRYEVHVLGLNYHGDPDGRKYPYDIYPAISGGDHGGYGRVKGLMEAIKPGLVIVQNDPWNIPSYLQLIGSTPTIGYVAADGKNVKGGLLNGLKHAAFWTEFADEEARKGGFRGTSSIIPLGVDLEQFAPMDRDVVRKRMLAPLFAQAGLPEDAFVIGMVGRNQWRKRIDLTIEYFADWIKSRGITDAVLWIHSAPSGDDAWDLDDLALHHSVSDRVFAPSIPRTARGASNDLMKRAYNMFDVLFSTTLGEGFGLPMFEAAACRCPLILPEWSGLGELFKDAAYLVPCTSVAVHPNQHYMGGTANAIGGIMDKELALNALDRMYENRELRATVARDCYSRVNEERFRWENNGKAWVALVDKVLNTPSRTVEYELANA